MSYQDAGKALLNKYGGQAQKKQREDAARAYRKENEQSGGTSSQLAPYGNPFYTSINQTQRQNAFNNVYREFDRLQSLAEDVDTFYGTWHSQEARDTFRANLGIDSAEKALDDLKKSYGGKEVKQLEDMLSQYSGIIGQYENKWSLFGSQEEYDGFQRFQEQMAGPMAELEKAQAAAEEAQKNLEALQQQGRPVYDDPKYAEKYLGYYDEETAANLANDDFIADLYQYDQKEAELQYAAEAAKTEQERQWYALEEARQGYFQDQLDSLNPNDLPAWALGEDTGTDLDAVLTEAEATEKAAQDEYDRFKSEEPLGTGRWTSLGVREGDAEYLVQQDYIRAKTEEYMAQHYPQAYAEEFARQDYEKAKQEYDEGVKQRYKEKEDAESYAQGRRNLKHNRDVDTVNMQELYAMSEENKAAFLNYLKAKEEFSQGGGDPTAEEPEYLQYKRALEDQYGSKRLRELEETYHRAQDEMETRATALQAEATAKAGGASAIPAYLLTFPAKLVGSLSGTLGSLADKLGGTGQYVGFNTSNAGNLPNVYADTLRGTMAGEIRGDGSSKIRNAASYGFQALNSAGDSLLRTVATGPYSLGLAASATFNDTILDATKKGASTPEAVTLGLLNAGIETLTEKIPLDNLLDNLGKNPGNWKNILWKAFGQGVTEASTEELSLIGTTLAEAAVLRQNAGYATAVRELKESGLSEQEAIAKANLQILEEAKETAIVSFLSGNISSLGSSAIGAMKNPEESGWHYAAELARQEDLNVMEVLDRAELFGAQNLARANPRGYWRSFQEALKSGASYDQALIQATSNAVMKTVGGQLSMDTLLYNIGGDPKKAVDALRGVLNRAGIDMTPGELNLLGIIAAEASAYQRDSSFPQKVAIEMLKGYPKEDAWTAASQTLWREATDRAIEFGIPDFDLVGKGRRNQRMLAQTLHSWEEQEIGRDLNPEYMERLKSIGAENTELNSIENLEGAMYNNSKEFELLMGYSKAIKKNHISPLVGFDLYKRTNDDIQAAIVGQATETGIEIESFCTHFIDRVIGQTSDSHTGMRQGIPVNSILGALQNPTKLKEVRYMPDGDIRQQFCGNGLAVTISIRDRRLIQTNPWKGK